MVSIVLCTISISLAGVFKEKEPASIDDIEPACPSWIPVLFGLITPVGFTTSGILTKHLVSDRVKFDPSTISFSAYFLVNTIVLMFAIPYWKNVEFNEALFWIGFIGSVINTLGIVSIQNALSCGPAGPISAIAAVSAILLVVIEAVKQWKMLSLMETIGLIFGIYGALVLVIPTFFEKLCCFCCPTTFQDEDDHLANAKNNTKINKADLDGWID